MSFFFNELLGSATKSGQTAPPIASLIPAVEFRDPLGPETIDGSLAPPGYNLTPALASGTVRLWSYPTPGLSFPPSLCLPAPVLVTPGDTQFSHLSLPHAPTETLAWIRNPHPISAHSTSFSRTRLPEQVLPAPHSTSRGLSCHTPVTCMRTCMSRSELLRFMRI